MGRGGHIYLHRSLFEWEWYGDKNTTRLFIHLLLDANWKPGQWRGTVVERGQTITSREKLSEETGLSIQQVRTSLNKLKSTGELTVKTTSKYTSITINNYDKYQTDNQQSNQPVTSNQPTNNQQITTIEEEQEANKTTTATTAREESLKRLVHFYEGNKFGAIARSHFEDMAAYLDKGVDALLIERCMKEAVDCGSPTWKYAVRILQRCQTQQIVTVEQFEAEKRKRTAQKENTTHGADTTALPGALTV